MKNKPNNDEHQQDYRNAREALLHGDRMTVGLPCLPDKKMGDLLHYVQLARMTIKIWDDLCRLKAVVHEDYAKVLQMTTWDNTEAMVLATRKAVIEDVLIRHSRHHETEIENEIGERVLRP